MLSGLRAAALHPDVIIATLKAVVHNGGPDHGLQEAVDVLLHPLLLTRGLVWPVKNAV
jgi:hypothetical protein